MVCKLSELYFKEGSLMDAAKFPARFPVKTGVKPMPGKKVSRAVSSEKVSKSRLEHELAFLFGAEILQRSQRMSIDEMFMQAEHIDESVSKLQAQAGKPEAQRDIVKGMSDGIAMALCKWISEAL